jgi:hypothetical protein
MLPLFLAEFDLEFLRGFLNYGAVGVLAIAFVVLLVLFWKKDERAAEMFQLLKDGHQDEAGNKELASRMIEVIRENSEATVAMREHMERVSDDIRRLEGGIIGHAAAEQHENTIRRLERDFGGRIAALVEEIRSLREKLP